LLHFWYNPSMSQEGQPGRKIRVINTQVNSPAAGGLLPRLLSQARHKAATAFEKEMDISKLPTVDELIEDKQKREQAEAESRQRLRSIRQDTFGLASEYTRGMQGLAEELYAAGKYKVDASTIPPVLVSSDCTVNPEGDPQYPLEVRYAMVVNPDGVETAKLHGYKQSLHTEMKLGKLTPTLYVLFDDNGNFQSVTIAVERRYAGHFDGKGNIVENTERIDRLPQTNGKILQSLLGNIDSSNYTSEALLESALGIGGLGISLRFDDPQGRPVIEYLGGSKPDGLKQKTTYVYNPDSNNFELQEVHRDLAGTLRRSFGEREQLLPGVLLSGEVYRELIRQFFELIPSEVLS